MGIADKMAEDFQRYLKLSPEVREQMFQLGYSGPIRHLAIYVLCKDLLDYAKRQALRYHPLTLNDLHDVLLDTDYIYQTVRKVLKGFQLPEDAFKESVCEAIPSAAPVVRKWGCKYQSA